MIGCIDFAYCFAIGRRFYLLIMAWLNSREDERPLLLAGSEQEPIALQCQFFHRQDVQRILGPCRNSRQANAYGFVSLLEITQDPHTITLALANDENRRVAAPRNTEALSGARALVEKIASLPVPDSDKLRVIGKFGSCITNAFIQEAEWLDTPSPRVTQLGKKSAFPEYSLIIPAITTAEILQTQLMLLSEDPEIREHAEIIYLAYPSCGNPELLRPLACQGRRLSLDCKLVELPGNPGIQTLWNKGAQLARGDRVVYMMPQVLPVAGGWLSRMLSPRGSIAGAATQNISCEISSGLSKIDAAQMRVTPMPAAETFTPSHPCFYAGPVLVAERLANGNPPLFNPAFGNVEMAFMELSSRLQIQGTSFHYISSPQFFFLQSGYAEPSMLDFGIFLSAINDPALASQGDYAWPK